MDDLNRKLAEWAGFYCLDLKFTHSLDACFKWLVPKIRTDYPEHYFELLHFWVVDMVKNNVDPAQSLCDAIWKLVRP